MRSPWTILVGTLVLVGLAIAVHRGVLGSFSPAALRDLVLEAGPWGAVAFLLAFALLQPIGVAAHVFVLTASLIWPPWQALALSWFGAMLAGSAAFWFARCVGHDFVQSRLTPRLRGYDERLAQRGFVTVLGMRLVFFTFGPMQLMFGVSRVRFGSFLAGSAIGLLPLIAFETFAGRGLLDWLG